ncbi:MAG: VTT domain-containing protein [Bryobacterales bacterium]|nr:VTT domain-containing protein [Bryobacterales bacterium]
MPDLGPLVGEYGYLLIAAFILLEQLGLPLPATPAMLAIGAYARGQGLSAPLLVLCGVVACVSADSLWYWLGRKHGNRLVRFLCRLTLEPDDCSRRSGDLYHRYGVLALVTAKFVPGLNTVAAPLAGVLRLKPRRFLLWDTAGATLWISVMVGLGYAFSHQVDAVARWLSHLGMGAAVVLFSFLIAYLGVKYWVRVSQKTEPEELWARIRQGETVAIVDLRHAAEVAVSGAVVPGAIQVLPQALSVEGDRIPAGVEVVLYCSCPNEATSARTAMRLQRRGVQHIRPLLGGFEGWVHAGLPVSSVRAVRLGAPGEVLYSNKLPQPLGGEHFRVTTTSAATGSGAVSPPDVSA